MATDDQNQSGESDAVVDAIDDVSRAVKDNVKDEKNLLDELTRVRRKRIAGVPMREAIGGSGRPRTLTILSRIADRFSISGARLRRVFVTSLVQEGESVNSVARRFEVTHQRISALLRRDRD